jgi:acetyl esterase/lipase
MALACMLVWGSVAAKAEPVAPAAGDIKIAASFGAREAMEHVSLSPDGSKVAFIAPTAGQGSALFTMGTEEGAKRAIVIAASGDPERLTECHWVSNKRLVCTLYGVMKDVNEILPFSRLIAVDADGSRVRMLSTKQNIYSRGIQLGGGDVIDWLPESEDAVLMSRVYIPDDHLGSKVGSEREGLAVDRLDTQTMKVNRVEEARKNAWEYLSDGRGAVRIMGLGQNDGNGRDTGVVSYRYRTRDSREWKVLGDFNTVTEVGFNPHAIDCERDAVYGFRKKDGRWALYRIKLDGSLAEELVYARPDVDLDRLVRVGRRNRVVGVSYVTDVRHSVYFDEELNELFASLTKALPNQPKVRIADASLDEGKLLIWAGSDNDPGLYYVFDRASRRMAILAPVRPQLEGLTLANVKPVTYPAADGTMVPGYLTMPPGGSGKGLPAIVLPHGGPAARDEWGFDWLSQYYAARGYAVLQPNFRGSTGYGDGWFQENGFRSWKVAIGDVLDAGRWLVKEGIADPARLGIVGWSYGGYAALQSAVVDPSLFKAVVAIAPVTDLAALKEESRYWSNFKIVRDYIGSGPHIREGSPAQNAARIKAPVLMFHAELDRNVRISESRLMDGKLKEAGVPHELVTWPGLDHYLEDSAARATMLEKSDTFLRASMGM